MQQAARVSIRPTFYRGATTRPQPSDRRSQLSRTLTAPTINRWQLLPTFVNQALDAARLTAVFEISQSLMKAQGTTVKTPGDALDAVLDRTYEGVTTLFPNAEVAIELRAGILDRELNDNSFPILSQNGSSGLVSQITREPVSVEDVSRSMMGLPLLDSRQNLLGMIVVSLGRERNSSDATVAEQLRQTASMVIERTVEREQLIQTSTIDGLTGLNNRRSFDDRIKIETGERKRKLRDGKEAPTPLSLLMIDLDHFTRINTNFGHPGGDSVLKEFGALLRQIPRPGDSSFRYGGEEFAVIARNTDAKGAYALANRIVRTVRNHKFTTRDGKHVPVTVSIGISTWNNGQNSPEWIEAADKRLYLAKNEGRDQAR
ncbi:MAG: GGDEF domain-containing protein [Candidatus Margulisiibacteriota bacterium]